MNSNLKLSRPCSVCFLPSRYICKMPSLAAYYDIEVVQFWRGQKERLQPYPLHWAIYIPTGPGIGNTYHILGNTDTYTIDFRCNQPYPNPDAWRGSFRVGRIAAHQLTALERYLASIPITRHDPSWNCQSWVWDSLRHLRHQGFDINWEIRLSDLQAQMCCLLEDWEYGLI
ncbi:hypothetical protein DEU56DRAFT_388313 [Suillus clintonianus]|uniref:uncharacterized protein n=1 Tax=Suillus clintonianus TaxID=1904413 RepID=UPI001B85FB98|nr:uncharacterized protein DEU56DRAFT_388313 [Suillus clintonianus]KAG2135777.1 hypothetical protein DEU56DRAFT_388313 [Suillus clintonianus]